MWKVRSILDWLISGRPEWQVFHDDSVFESLILTHPNGGATLRYLYRGQLYDERIFSSRADARREAAQLHLRLKALGWQDGRTSRAVSVRARLRT